MTATGDRTAGMRAARAKDSAGKRRRVLAALGDLEAAGTPVTVSAVAKAAGVSTWLVYADGVRDHLDAARRRQTQPGQTLAAGAAWAANPPRSPLPACAPTSPSPATRSAGCAANTTSSDVGYACNSAPRSTRPTGPT